MPAFKIILVISLLVLPAGFLVLCYRMRTDIRSRITVVGDTWTKWMAFTLDEDSGLTPRIIHKDGHRKDFGGSSFFLWVDEEGRRVYSRSAAWD